MCSRPSSDLRWQWCTFDELTTSQLYEVFKARLAVFSVEQECWYQDADDADHCAWHLLGWHDKTSELLAYLRLLPPSTAFPEPSLGRILTRQAARGCGVGHQLMQQGLQKAEELFPGQDICIGAQHRLVTFYQQYGFEIVSEPYEEDRILHIHMKRRAS